MEHISNSAKQSNEEAKKKDWFLSRRYNNNYKNNNNNDNGSNKTRRFHEKICIKIHVKIFFRKIVGSFCWFFLFYVCDCGQSIRIPVIIYDLFSWWVFFCFVLYVNDGCCVFRSNSSFYYYFFLLAITSKTIAIKYIYNKKINNTFS